jgi:poly-gamma-glutamate capsule biosynthesis protein CapA/YwtB (metallophosphatase superfamily)
MKRPSSRLTVFLGGDVMTGRGIDQILPFPSDPALHEPLMKNAGGYVELAEALHGPIPRLAAPPYIWGDALDVLREARPDARIVNLETSVTTSGDWADKGINYRMHPKNVACLTAAGIDCCALANNHVLDWGEQGLRETLAVLHGAGIRTAGAGRNLQEAQAPAILDIPKQGRVIVFALGDRRSGIPGHWVATEGKPGVDAVAAFSREQVHGLAARTSAVRGRRDVVVVSIHWGENWGYEIPDAQRRFAQALIDEAQVDVVHGHSSHHAKAIEIYKGKLILYSCGDLVTDYEGIGGREEYRGDLGVLYFAGIDPETGKLHSLDLVPMQTRRFRLAHASAQDVRWLRDVLNREGTAYATRVVLRGKGRLAVKDLSK